MNILVIDDERVFTKVENAIVPYLDRVVYARDYQTASDHLLLERDYHWARVYLDHDLGPGQADVKHLTSILEGLAYSSGVLLNVDEFVIHSANPVGRAEMYHALAPFYNVRFARAEDLI